MSENETPEWFPLLRWDYDTKVPWAMVAPHEKQSIQNHYQSLRRIAERGGFSSSEMMAVLEDRRWRKMPDADEKLLAAVAAWWNARFPQP